MRIILGVGTGLMILFVALFFALWFIPDMVIALGVALIVASIPYFVWVFPNCTINVPPDRAWIVANVFKTESAKELETFSGHREIKAQKEFGAGFHFIFFWENPDKEVNLTRLILVENDETEPYTLANGVKTIHLKWQVPIAPIPGDLVYFIRNRPKVIQTRLGKRVDRFVQGYVGQQPDMTYDKKQIDSIVQAYVNEFHPENYIDDEFERPMGAWLGDIEVFDIDQPKMVQEARNISQKIEMFSNLVRDLVEKGIMDHASAWKFVTSIAGNTKIDLLEVGGLLPTTTKIKK